MSPAVGGIAIARCERCGAEYFPRRLLCRRCGGRSFQVMLVTEGVAEEVTTVRQAVGEGAREATVLATVRLAGGQRVIAGSTTPLDAGTTVALSEDEGAVMARPAT